MKGIPRTVEVSGKELLWNAFAKLRSLRRNACQDTGFQEGDHLNTEHSRQEYLSQLRPREDYFQSKGS